MKHNRVPIKFTAVLLCAALVLPLFASCSVSLTDPEPALLANISITPQKADDAGVAYDSGFLITADVPLTQRELEKGLVVEPEIDYALSATAAGFILKPAEPLAPNAVYAFTLGTQEGRTRTWAFQSRRPFSILSASPADDATDVNIYSSVEFKMTHTGVDLIGNFEVTPPIDFNVSSSGRTAYLYPVESFKPNTRYTVTVKKGLESPLGDILAEDYNLTFTTGSTSDNSYRRNDGVPLYLYGEYGETFLPGDTPVIRIGANNQSPDGKGVLPVDLSVSVYEFGGSERYMQALSGYDTYIEQGGDVDSYRCDEDALTHVVSFETQMYMSEDYYTGYGYVILPESLPKGWYAVNITTTTPKGVECTIQKLLQVSDVAVYSESVNG
ncbi:MAG: Ig-like domain-containing protein, partial [Acetanaerobacterium sp.]